MHEFEIDSKTVEKRLSDLKTWTESMRRKGLEITEEEADKLLEEGASAFFDLPSTFGPCGGFVPGPRNGPEIVVVTEYGYFVRSPEDLTRYDLFGEGDGVLVDWIERLGK